MQPKSWQEQLREIVANANTESLERRVAKIVKQKTITLVLPDPSGRLPGGRNHIPEDDT